jgi:hypothetical protein
MLRQALQIAGILLLALGLLFLLQGAGIVHWPRESFMLGQRAWVWNGGGIALAGAVLVFLSRRF